MKTNNQKKQTRKIKKPETSDLFPKPSELILAAAQTLDRNREELGISPEVKSFCMADNLLTSLEMEKPSFLEYARKGVMIPIFFVRESGVFPLKIYLSNRPRAEITGLDLSVRLCFCDRILEAFPIRGIEPGISPWQKFFQMRVLLRSLFRGKDYLINGWTVNNNWCRVVPEGAFVETPDGERKTDSEILRKHRDDFLDFDHEKNFNRWLCSTLEMSPATPITGTEDLIEKIKWLAKTIEERILIRWKILPKADQD